MILLYTAGWFPTGELRATRKLSLLTAVDAVMLSFFKSAISPLPVQEGAGEDITIMLLGNKTDKEIERQVQKGVGERLAKVTVF